MVRPELAREGRFLRRDGEQEQVIDRQHRPDEDRDADQQQLRLGRAVLRRQLSSRHLDSRFIMK